MTTILKGNTYRLTFLTSRLFAWNTSPTACLKTG